MNLSYRNQISANAISRIWNKPLDKPDWYKVEASAGDNAEIIIYDVIGWPFNDAAELVRVVLDLRGKPVLARINSPGGDLVDAIAIYQSFKEHGNVTTRIESLAASSASLLILGGKERQAYPSSTFMMHEPWLLTIGNMYSHEENLDIISQFSAKLVDLYAESSTVGKREAKQLMKGEDKRDGTWLTAELARDKGFITTILKSGKAAKASFDLSIFAGAPSDVLNDIKDPAILTGFDVEKILHDAKASKGFAKAAAAACRAAGLFDRCHADDDHEGKIKAEKDDHDAKELVQYLTIASELKKLTSILTV